MKNTISEFLGRDWNDNNVHVYIGDEVECPDLSDVSLVVKKYSCKGKSMGCLGVIGPTRMHYDKTVNVVDKMADTMTNFLNQL